MSSVKKTSGNCNGSGYKPCIGYGWASKASLNEGKSQGFSNL